MSYVSTALAHAVPGVGIADSADALSVIAEPSCAAAVWPRQLPGLVQDWLEGLPPAALPQGRLILRPNAVADAVGHLFDMAGTPDCDERNWLWADITKLADTFARMMSVDYLRVRLDVVTTNACRRFHVDAVTARLVCTYRGHGTQYGISANGNDPERIHDVTTGAPFVMRGTLWPTVPLSDLLHRSPPIEGTGETRLLLVVDPIVGPRGGTLSGNLGQTRLRRRRRQCDPMQTYDSLPQPLRTWLSEAVLHGRQHPFAGFGCAHAPTAKPLKTLSMI